MHYVTLVCEFYEIFGVPAEMTPNRLGDAGVTVTVMERTTATDASDDFEPGTPWIGIANKQLELMAKFMAELGLTPSSRSRLAIQVPNGPKPWQTADEVLARRRPAGQAGEMS